MQRGPAHRGRKAPSAPRRTGRWRPRRGQQLLDVFRPPQERRQDLRGEADALAAGTPSVREVGAAVAELRPGPPGRLRPGVGGRRTEIGPMPVWISRSGACPLRTTSRRPRPSSTSACAPRNAPVSASITCCNIRRAPDRNTSSSGSSAILDPGRAKRTTVSLSPPGPAGPVSCGDRIKGLLAFDGVSFRVTSNLTEDTPPQPSSTKFEHSSKKTGNACSPTRSGGPGSNGARAVTASG
jgi:hypothetical protein